MGNGKREMLDDGRMTGMPPACWRAVCAGVVFLSLQCGVARYAEPDGTRAPLREQLQIVPNTPDVPLDGSLRISVRSRDQFTRVQLPVTWSSDNPEVISVQGTGLEAVLRSFRTGSARITATDASGASATVQARSRGPG